VSAKPFGSRTPECHCTTSGAAGWRARCCARISPLKFTCISREFVLVQALLTSRFSCGILSGGCYHTYFIRRDAHCHKPTSGEAGPSVNFSQQSPCGKSHRSVMTAVSLDCYCNSTKLVQLRQVCSAAAHLGMFVRIRLEANVVWAVRERIAWQRLKVACTAVGHQSYAAQQAQLI
jgi:hypothetical protein